MLKNSRQRNSIKQLLMHRTDHPTAAAIYEDVKKEYPNISLGTVYRNLNLMVQLGEIRKVDGGDEADHYDANMAPHYHLICRRCGAVHDLNMPVPEHVKDIAAQYTEDTIDTFDLTFFGICRDCREQDPYPVTM